MSILVNKDTKIITQGITGRAGLFHSHACEDYGSQIVGGVTPGKAGAAVGFTVWNSVKEAVDASGADTSMIFVPPAYAAGAMIDAIENEIRLIIAITEGIPVMDMLKVKDALKGSKTMLLGPNCPGVITPDECKAGIMPGYIHQRGKIGIISRSGTLTYEAVHQTTLNGLGQTTAVGIGGDPVHGLTFLDVLKMFNEDSETEGIIIIGEIGGTEELVAADYIEQYVRKPMAGFIAGSTAPPGKRMGHAGAIVEGKETTAAAKISRLEKAGVFVASTAADIGEMMKNAMIAKGLV